MNEWCPVCGFRKAVCTCVKPGTNSCRETYIPVPLWQGDRWLPWNVATERLMQWPEWMTEKRVAELPHPIYMPGEEVRFNWSFGQSHIGTVQRITLHGGRTYLYELDRLDLVIKQHYSRHNMLYTIRWQGHGRWVDEKDILGRA